MIPRDLQAVLLDAGNVLVGIDLPWIVDLLAERGVEVELDRLRRAEAAARPAVARAVAGNASTESDTTFRVYVEATLAGLGLRDEALRDDLILVLKGAGNARLWSWRQPRVVEAVDILRGMGLRLAVVSNSDGTIAETLAGAGLGDRFDAVIDSAVVGFEKPDPRIFAAALDAVHVAPERALHVGDLYSVDVVGARRAGVAAVLVDPFDDWTSVDCPRVRGLAELTEEIAATRRSA